MHVELTSLNKEPTTRSTKILREAAAKLGLTEYERFKGAFQRGVADYELLHVLDPESDEVIGVKVCSTRNPDAPPRQFLFTSNDRCKCKERVAHLGQCLHEILKDGFDKNKFQEMHFRRTRVTGSLTGWTQAAETAAYVDKIIGYEPEEIVMSSGHSPILASSTTNLHKNLESPLPGYMPDTSSNIKPFKKNVVDNIFNSVSASYTRMDNEKKFKINALAMELEHLLLSDSNGTTVEHSSGGVCVDIPSQELIAKQPKNRLMPVREMNKRKKNKKFKHILGRWNCTSLFVFGLTYMIVPLYPLGMKQVVSGKKHDILVNPRTAIRSCTFCHNCKSVTNCSRRTDLKRSAFEYVLTTDDYSVQHALIARFDAMPIAPSLKGSVIGNVSSEYLKANFIIHSASLIEGRAPGIHGMNFCVSFLTPNAMPLEEVWVSGSAMNTMATHGLKKKKYVYDQTMISKDGWTARILVPMKNDSPVNYESSDEDNTPISQLAV